MLEATPKRLSGRGIWAPRRRAHLDHVNSALRCSEPPRSGAWRNRFGPASLRTDPFVTKVYPMTTDLPRFSSQVASVQASGGGDTPESVNEGAACRAHAPRLERS